MTCLLCHATVAPCVMTCYAGRVVRPNIRIRHPPRLPQPRLNPPPHTHQPHGKCTCDSRGHAPSTRYLRHCAANVTTPAACDEPGNERATGRTCRDLPPVSVCRHNDPQLVLHVALWWWWWSRCSSGAQQRPVHSTRCSLALQRTRADSQTHDDEQMCSMLSWDNTLMRCVCDSRAWHSRATCTYGLHEFHIYIYAYDCVPLRHYNRGRERYRKLAGSS